MTRRHSGGPILALVGMNLGGAAQETGLRTMTEGQGRGNKDGVSLYQGAGAGPHSWGHLAQGVRDELGGPSPISERSAFPLRVGNLRTSDLWGSHFLLPPL